jgi:hypothetical protein
VGIFVERVCDLSLWFADALEDLKCRQDTRAYVVGALSKRWLDEDDLSDRSLVLTYASARNERSFVGLQRIGDWILYSESIHPLTRDDAQKELVVALGQCSYEACDRLLMHRWPLYEELAERLPEITSSIHTYISAASVINTIEKKA